MAQKWKIVGGADKGGILVREGKDTTSPKYAERLSTGASVEELEFVADGGRLKYKLLKGSGPPTGWIAIALPGKDLAVRDGAPPLPKAGIEPPAYREARVETSREKLRARRAGEKYLPPELKLEQFPARLGEGVLGPYQPWVRHNPKVLMEVCKENKPGMLSGMPFPHTAKQIEEFGAEWITHAFHKFKTLPEDNSVKRLVSVDPLPLSGFDTCGGSGPKAFFTVEYEKDDPNLHTRLFAKMPWDPHGSYPGVPESTPETYRRQISGGGDGDFMEIFTSMNCEHLFPFPIPKFYFGDICRETTNFIFIVECLPFGKRGKVENGKVVEEIKREPYDMLPVCGKYQDFLLDDPAAIYFQVFRMLAGLAAWDQQGRFDHLLGPMTKYTPEAYLANSQRKKVMPLKRKDITINGATRMIEPALDFATNIAPYLFSKEAISKKNLDKFKNDVLTLAPMFEDFKFYCGNDSNFQGVAHWNCQADNAFFWRDENGDLDGGILDWSGFSRPPHFVQSFLGCLLGMESDLLLEIEANLMKCFCDEYERCGGPRIDADDLLLRWHLYYTLCSTDTCRWIEQDTLREMPKEEWKDITGRFDPKFMGTWNVRTRTTTFINLLEYWRLQDLRGIVDKWANGPGKEYLTEYSG